MSAYLGEFVDEGEFAGYVDSGIYELELWLEQANRQRVHGLHRLMQHLAMLDIDDP